jgi:hypothetical protein
MGGSRYWRSPYASALNRRNREAFAEAAAPSNNRVRFAAPALPTRQPSSQPAPEALPLQESTSTINNTSAQKVLVNHSPDRTKRKVENDSLGVVKVKKRKSVKSKDPQLEGRVDESSKLRNECKLLKARNKNLEARNKHLEKIVSQFTVNVAKYHSKHGKDEERAEAGADDERGEEVQEDDNEKHQREEEEEEAKEETDVADEREEEEEEEEAKEETDVDDDRVHVNEDNDADFQGADVLPRVIRAGGGPPGEFMPLPHTEGADEFRSAKRSCIEGASKIKGVEMKNIVKYLSGWVQPSKGDNDFAMWLRKTAQIFSSLKPPENLEVFFNDANRAPIKGLREFTDTGVKFKSPLDQEESDFSRTPYNAVHIAARTLEVSDEELREALKVAKSGNSRKYVMRATYLWLIHISGEPILVYVGESRDAELRISTHLTSLFYKADGARMQNGHRVAREHMHDKSSEDIDVRLFVISAHDEHSALYLAKSYVDFCGENKPTILEVARACAATGFYSEAVYTAAFESLHEQSRRGPGGRIGLNFSQPGIMHPPATNKLSLKNRINLSLASFNSTGSSKVEPQLMFCETCDNWKHTIAYAKDGTDKQECKVCYETTRYANTERFKCEVCEKYKTGFQKKFTYPDGRDGVRCQPCHNIAVRAKREPWKCDGECQRVMPGPSERRRHPNGGYQCPGCARRAKTKQARQATTV